MRGIAVFTLVGHLQTGEVAMKPEGTKPLKFAMYGAFAGLAYAAFTADYNAAMPDLVGEFIGGAVGGAFLFGVAVFVQNRFNR